MSTLTLPQTNGSKAFPAAQPWQRDSVRTFFTGVNWEDYAPAVQEIKLGLGEGGNAPLKLKLSVCQFFAAVNWDGIAIAAPTPVQPTPPPAADELTLDGFSGLF
ncbi:hypothetical protein [Stenomitos frigidus]|uniref:Uncharacterized protein n=1 Tax=Stenomitos frigidus ULC18 TaxID=2107698 RepID=A0A2T1EGP8_9CYAN|nr:hypothetical protein [Stenomitos frigidus]PSB31916.1 hypothetical protein C7B82_06800 [Stenomitos frigidus ULC18]